MGKKKTKNPWHSHGFFVFSLSTVSTIPENQFVSLSR